MSTLTYMAPERPRILGKRMGYEVLFKKKVIQKILMNKKQDY